MDEPYLYSVGQFVGGGALKVDRRSLLGLGVSVVCVRSLLLPVGADADGQLTNQNTKLNPLIEALTRTGKSVCTDVGQLLNNRPVNDSTYNLHLRTARLNEDDAKAIASAIKTVHVDSALRLNSFSVSYNPRIQMDGATELLEVLPSHLTELGMVGCSLNDELEWAITSFLSRSTHLRLICVEENDFSLRVKGAIRDATRHLSRCVVIV